MTPPTMISDEMVHEAKRRGWSASTAARKFGFHHSSFYRKAERMGVRLVDERVRGEKTQYFGASDERVKSPWSCSPAAIARALAKLDRREAQS